MLTFITFCLFVLCVTFLVYHVRRLACDHAEWRRDRDEFLKQHWLLGLARYHVSTLVSQLKEEERNFCDKQSLLERLEDLKMLLYDMVNDERR